MPKPPETLVPLPQPVNLGAILDMPFLYQLTMPASVATMVESTLLPTRIAFSTTSYVFAAPGQPISSTYEGPGSRKETQYHYTPADPEELIREMRAKDEALQAEHDASRDEGERARIRALQQVYRDNIRNLQAMQATGQQPLRLTRVTWTEFNVGDPIIHGEMVLNYKGLDPAEAEVTTRVEEDPPKIDVITRKYNYNPRGQLVSMDIMDSITEYTYDPGGRLILSANDYLSPAGDFKMQDQVVYLYAPPPGADPVPANALLMTIDDAYSGPVGSFPEAPGLEIAPPEAPALEAPALEPPGADVPLGEVPALETPQMPASDLPTAAVQVPEVPGVEVPGAPGMQAPGVGAPSVPGMDANLAGAAQQVTAGLDLPTLAASMEAAGAPEVPTMELPGGELPDVPGVEMPSAPGGAGGGLPAAPQVPEPPLVEMPEVEVPGAELPGVEAPDVALPETPEMPDVSSIPEPPEIPEANLALGKGDRMAPADVPAPPPMPGLPQLPPLPSPPDKGEDITRVTNVYVYGPI